jgi:hypothetical protein
MVQVMGLLQVVVFMAASKLESQAQSGQARETSQKQTVGEASSDVPSVPPVVAESSEEDKAASAGLSVSDGKRSIDASSVFLQLPQADLRNLCSLLGREGYFQFFTLVHFESSVLSVNFHTIFWSIHHWLSAIHLYIIFYQKNLFSISFLVVSIFLYFCFPSCCELDNESLIFSIDKFQAVR